MSRSTRRILSARSIDYRRPPRAKPIDLDQDDEEYDQISSKINRLNLLRFVLMNKFIHRQDHKQVEHLLQVRDILVYQHLELGHFLIFIVQSLQLMNKRKKIILQVI